MSIEHREGKARPTLPKARDLKPVPAAGDRSDSRDSSGRFAAGNAGGKGRGWKHAIAKMLGRHVGDLADVATSVAEDAWRLFSVSIREMPNDGPTVRALVARRARHEALEGYWTAKALAKLGTPEGDAAEAKATAHGLRAERLTVTALDVATKLAATRPTYGSYGALPARAHHATDLETQIFGPRPPQDEPAYVDEPEGADQDHDALSEASTSAAPETTTRVVVSAPPAPAAKKTRLVGAMPVPVFGAPNPHSPMGEAAQRSIAQHESRQRNTNPQRR